MPNQAPRLYDRWRLRGRGLTMLLLAVWLIGAAVPGLAADRRFAVILAYPAKTFQAAGEEAEFANPAMVKAQYFDTNPNNDIYSLAEWWDEISYGAVTVSGDTFGWLNLPWPLQPIDADGDGEVDSPDAHVNLDFNGDYHYGVGEPFAEDPMPVPQLCFDGLCDGVPIDYNGDSDAIDAQFLGSPLDANPTAVLVDPDDCECCPSDGGQCEAFKSDTDGDNINDSCADVAESGSCCVEHPSAGCRDEQGGDTDCHMAVCAEPGLDDCCWDEWHGGCVEEAFTNEACDCAVDVDAVPVERCGAHTCCLPFECAPLCTWVPDGDTGYYDCSTGGLRPSECVAAFGVVVGGEPGDEEPPIDCVRPCEPCPVFAGYGGSLARGPNIASMPLKDAIFTPGERFRDADESGPDARYNALLEPVVFEQNVGCDPFLGDHLDVDEDGTRDRPEPFEDYLRRWDPFQFAGAGEWVPVSEGYIRGNYPERRSVPDGRDFPGAPPPECSDTRTPDCWNDHCVAPYCWNAEVAINSFISSFTSDCDLRSPAEEDSPHCVYFKEEMFRIRGLGDFDAGDLFVLDDTAIADWSNVDELAWRTGNGVYDPPERFRDVRDPDDDDDDVGSVSTKMQHVARGGDPWRSAVPLPGNYGTSFDDIAWYETFWRARYGTNPPAWAKGKTGRNSPRMLPFDPLEPHPDFVPPPTEDDLKRRFVANAGRPDTDTQEGPLAGEVEPDETVGYYDGWVEHDDLASSRYHAFGDQRLGEVTSPNLINSNGLGGIDGQDIGVHKTVGIPNPDNKTVAAGPLALHVHGNNGLDAGNLLVLEWMTWRTDINSTLSAVAGAWSSGMSWDWEATALRGRALHPYAGPSSGMGEDVDGDSQPDGWGFRDYNLDGLIDQGEVRPRGSENYTIDSIFGTGNLGTETEYPFNRRRLLEDCIEVLDFSTDFDLFRDTNTLEKLVGGAIPGVLEGLVSGIVLFPPNSTTGDIFPRAPSFYPIHIEDRPPTRPSARFAAPGRPTVELPVADTATPDVYNSTLWFHDLPAPLDFDGPCDGPQGRECEPYLIKYAAHEYGHTWEGYPDLYDYEVYQPNPINVRQPVGLWGVMANGGLNRYPAHPVPDLKSEYSEWIELVNLRTQLTPGVEREITFANSETTKQDTYYYFENPLVVPNSGAPRYARARERFYFWRAGFFGAGTFGRFLPGQGVLIMHTDWQGNSEALPPQQGDPFTWNVIQADGLYELDAGINGGDSGDPFPGRSGTTVWNHDSFPDAHSRWGGDAFSGIEITDIIEAQGGTRVVFNWTPTEVPSMTFVSPPGGATVEGVYNIAYRAYDLYAGTTLEFYYDTNSEAYGGTLIGSTGKDTPRILESGTIGWDLNKLDDEVPDGLYFLYAKLVPGVGEEGNTEPSIGEVLPARDNAGNGTLTSPTDKDAGPIVNLNTSKLEGWTITAKDNDGTWSVEGSLSGQHADAETDKDYISNIGEVRFRIRSGSAPSTPFEKDDQFTFVTTGFTAYSAGISVKEGVVSDAPIARIIADVVGGKPPLIVAFDARSSDPNGAPSLNYEWNFGDGTSPATGDEVEHTYENPGTYTATLTATNPNTGAFGTAAIEIRVENEGPTAVIQYTVQTADGSFPYEVRFSGSKSEDPEDLPLEFLWTFDDRRDSTSTEMDPPEHTYFEDQANPGWYCANVTLEVTDSAEDTDTATATITPGLAEPTVLFTATPSTGVGPLEVDFDAALTVDPNDDPTVTYTWNFGDPGSLANNAGSLTASHTFESPGTYVVTLTLRYNSDNCQADFVETRQIRVLEVVGSPDDPIVLFTPDPPSGPAPLEVTFDASESYDPQGDPMSFGWDFGDGMVGTGEVVAHTYSAVGSFLVTLSVTDDQDHTGFHTEQVTVTAPGGGGGDSDNLAPSAFFIADPESGDAPLTVEFNSTSSDPEGGALAHEWDFDDGGRDTTVNPIHTFTDPGSYTVTLAVTDSADLSDATSRVIQVNQRTNKAPVARIATAPEEVNAPGDLILDATLSTDLDGDSLTYTWEISRNEDVLDFGAPLTGPILVVRFRNPLAQCEGVAAPCLEPGTYFITVTVEDGFGGKDISDAMRVVFDPSESGGFLPGDGTQPEQGLPDRVSLTGSSGGSSGSGLCGLGMLMPTMLTGLVMVAAMVNRRRRW